MHRTPELEYFRRVLERLRLQTQHFAPGSHGALPEFLRDAPDWARPNTIYKLADSFQRRFIYFLLPEGGSLLIGPWLDREKSRESLLEQAERLGLPASRAADLEQFYADIPVVADPTNLFTMVNVLGETLWGTGTAFSIQDVNRPQPEEPLLPEGPQAELLSHIQQVETRYNYENELIETVTQGLEHRAELMLRGFSRHTLEMRTADPLRNTKNYCIVCNTLLRKAAEKGGVHPVELDRLSSRMARRIEEQGTPEQSVDLMREMVRAYCRLVRRHTEGIIPRWCAASWPTSKPIRPPTCPCTPWPGCSRSTPAISLPCFAGRPAAPSRSLSMPPGWRRQPGCCAPPICRSRP